MLWFMRLRRFFKATGRDALVLWHACRTPGAPSSIRLLALAMVLYVISPIDILPDFALVLGLADDLAILVMGIPFLLNRMPANIVQEATAKADNTLRRWGMGAGTSSNGV